MRRHSRRQRNGYLMLLLFQLFQRVQRLERKPPVTLALMAFMIAIYVQPSFAPSIGETCLSSSNADPFRMIGSAFLHVDERHLYCNMASLLWKGVQIELAAGSIIFTAMISILLLLSHGLYIIVGNVVGGAGCAVGFSAVLFALKVVLNDGSSTHSSIFGISVPTQYAVWLELIVASVISPSASFLGHLCGILAGYLWVRGGVGKKVGEIVTGNGGNAQAWYNPIGFSQRTNPNNGGFFNGVGNMFQGLFNVVQTVPQTGQQPHRQHQQHHQQRNQQPYQQQQNDMSTGFSSGLGGMFGGFFSGDQSVPQQQPSQRGTSKRGTTYGRGTTNTNTENEDAQMRAAMERSRREYAQTQSNRNNSREPTSSPPSLHQAEQQARWEQEEIEDAQMRAAMEQSRREYAQTQSNRNNSREPTSSPPSVHQAEQQARWEQEALNGVQEGMDSDPMHQPFLHIIPDAGNEETLGVQRGFRYCAQEAVGDETSLPGFRPNESDDIIEARNKERATIRQRRMQRFGKSIITHTTLKKQQRKRKRETQEGQGDVTTGRIWV